MLYHHVTEILKINFCLNESDLDVLADFSFLNW